MSEPVTKTTNLYGLKTIESFQEITSMEEYKTTPTEYELISNIVYSSFGDKFIKLQEDVINIGDHVIKLQNKVIEQGKVIDNLIKMVKR